jgi:hypothetical protein
MELSTRVDVLGSGDSFRNLEHRLRMIRSQQLDYHEHGIDAPPELERLAKRALVIGDEMTTGLPVDSARVKQWEPGGSSWCAVWRCVHSLSLAGIRRCVRSSCSAAASPSLDAFRAIMLSCSVPANSCWSLRCSRSLTAPWSWLAKP